MNSNVQLFASLIAISALGGCYVQTGAVAPDDSYEGDYVEAEEAPPAPPPPAPEPIPPPPSNEHVWIEAHFGWHAHAYRWERGHYEHRPHGHARWVPAHWEKRGHRRVWIDGRWN